MPYPYYPNYFYPTQSNAYPAQNNVGIVWVQGEAGAKSYLVGAGQSVLLMDSESNTFYIKSTDASGMPSPLRIFDYKERTHTQSATNATVLDPNKYVTRDEFNQLVDSLKKEVKDNGEQSVV